MEKPKQASVIRFEKQVIDKQQLAKIRGGSSNIIITESVIPRS